MRLVRPLGTVQGDAFLAKRGPRRRGWPPGSLRQRFAERSNERPVPFDEFRALFAVEIQIFTDSIRRVLLPLYTTFRQRRYQLYARFDLSMERPGRCQ